MEKFVIEKLSECHYFSSLDMAQGFFQIPITKDAKDARRATLGTILAAALAVVPLHYGTTLAVVPAQLGGGTTLAVVPVVPRCKTAARLITRNLLCHYRSVKTLP